MPASHVQLRIEVETEGAEQLTALRQQLDRLGAAGSDAFAQLDTSVAAVLDKLKLSRSLVAESTTSFIASQRQLIAGLAPLFDSFFRTVFTGSRSLRDGLKRLWGDFLDFFLGLTRRMVAGWLNGLQLMTGPALRGGFGGGGAGRGGIFGGILGGTLGIPGLGIPIGTPPTFPTQQFAGVGARFGLLPSAGLSALGGPASGWGAVTGPAGTIPGIGGAGGLTASGLGGVAGLLGLAGFAVAGAGVRRGNVALGGIGGFLAGGALGTLVGGSSLLAGTALGAFAGPIGAAIGAIVGVIMASLQRGKLKREASRIADTGFAEMRRVLEEFKRFQVDFESALSQVNAVWAQMVQGWSGMGKVGRRSIQSQQPFFQQIVDEINRIQKARELRGQIIGGLPIPEFQLGGMVRTIQNQNGRILAFLHQGEAVLNRRAVQAVGERRIDELNSRPFAAAQGNSFNITINAVDGESMERWLSRNEGRLVRFIRRAARDRGLRPPL